MKWIIDKSFDFCYGHRVHNQRLDTNFTENGNACLACRHLHGHQGQVKVFLASTGNNVQETGMVTDFKHLGWFKNFLDDVLDHKFIMDIKDPLFKDEFGLVESVSEMVPHKEGYFTPNLDLVCKRIGIEFGKEPTPEQQAIFEKYEGAVFVDFVPTSENLCAWLLSVCQEKMKPLSGVEVVFVEYWETPKSHCKVSI